MLISDILGVQRISPESRSAATAEWATSLVASLPFLLVDYMPHLFLPHLVAAERHVCCIQAQHLLMYLVVVESNFCCL